MKSTDQIHETKRDSGKINGDIDRFFQNGQTTSEESCFKLLINIMKNYAFFVIWLQAIPIIVGAFFYVMEADERKKTKHYQAWQVVNFSAGKGGSGGRINALQELNKDGISLSGVDLSGAWLQSIDLTKANLFEAKFQKADLSKAILVKANLEESDLENAILKEANLQDANIKRGNLSGANLKRSNMKGADLEGAKFENSNLQGADLQGANLEEAILTRADLPKAKLQGANLKGAILLESDLYDADLRKADLREVMVNIENLLEVKTLYEAKIEKKILETIRKEKPELLEPTKLSTVD